MTDTHDTRGLLDRAARRIDRRDAEILLAAAWDTTRSRLLMRDAEVPPPEVVARFDAWVARRTTGEPVAYLLGRREFWSLDLEVNPAVLVPRPETELLVERVLANVAARTAGVADLGTGSGAVAIALAHEKPDWRIVATDTSREALAVARRNGERFVPGRIEWHLNESWTEWFAPLAGRRFDAVASNPPYVAAGDPVLGEDGLRFEPRTALTPGVDGFAALSRLVDESPEHLSPEGWLVLEHGATQGSPLRSALVARGFAHVTSHRDLAGHERVTEAQWPSTR